MRTRMRVMIRYLQHDNAVFDGTGLPKLADLGLGCLDLFTPTGSGCALAIGSACLQQVYSLRTKPVEAPIDGMIQVRCCSSSGCYRSTQGESHDDSACWRT